MGTDRVYHAEVSEDRAAYVHACVLEDAENFGVG